MNYILSLVPAIEHVQTLGYWIGFFVALFETIIGVGWWIPGSTIVLFMGALAGRGYFDVGDLLWFVIIGAILGDNINYAIGRKYGSSIVANGFWFIKPSHIKRGEVFFESHGYKSVFIGRFIPSLKEITPLIAGIFRMKRTPFMMWNILGAVGWASAWVFVGYFFTQSLDRAHVWLTRVGFFLLIVVLVFILLYVLRVVLVKKGREFFRLLRSVWYSVSHAIQENEDVQRFVKRHSTSVQFVLRRFSTHYFSGLSFTLLAVAFLYVVSLLAGIVEDVVRSEVIVTTDTQVANTLVLYRHPMLTQFFSSITLLGEPIIVLLLAMATGVIFWLWNKRVYIIPMMISIIGSEIFTFIGKIVFHRARPDVAMIAEDSFGFPSGHATIAVALYGFIAYVMIKSCSQWNRKINVFFIGIIVIALIGFSRLYLGVHYVSDVWAGYLLGALWLIIAISFTEYQLYGRNSQVSSIQ